MAEPGGDGYTRRPATPPVTACINVYQDARWLETCLRSLAGKVRAIVVVDGAYEGFPHDRPHSTDGTLDIARQYADVVVEKRAAWPDETVKRNYYLRFVPVGSWWLRIDADEELRGGIAVPLLGVVYCIRLVRTDGIMPYPIHALFRRGRHSRYFGTHHAVWHGRTLLPKLEPGTGVPVLLGAELIHHNSEREQTRVEAKGEYYRNALTNRERDFRARFKV